MKNLFILLLSVCSFSAFAQIAVIVHPNNAVTASKSDIKKIYLGKIASFSDGKQAVALTLPEGNATRSQFISKVVGKNENQFTAHWSKMIFTGAATPPEEMSDANAVLQRVSADESAVGFITSDQVNPSVKVLFQL